MVGVDTSSGLGAAVEALRRGEPVAILDSEARERETDLFYPSASLQPAGLRNLRINAGGEMYIAVGQEVACTFGLPYIGEAFSAGGAAAELPVLAALAKQRTEGMCQGSCSVSLSMDHRSLHTGAPDAERSFTCRRLANLWQEVKGEGLSQSAAQQRLGAEFHTPGHIFLCVEHAGGLRARAGHTELSTALARHAGLPPLMVGCVMLCNEGEDFGALPPAAARAWAAKHGVPFVEGADILRQLGSKLQANGVHGNGTVAAASPLEVTA